MEYAKMVLKERLLSMNKDFDRIKRQCMPHIIEQVVCERLEIIEAISILEKAESLNKTLKE